MGFVPYTYNLTPPENSEENRVAIEQSMSAVRKKWESEKEKRIEVLSSGPELRDVDAAADCHCSCHPTSADTQLHDGGVSCSCQLTEQERKAAVKKFFDSLKGSMVRRTPEQHEQFLRELSELFDADIREAGGAAPYIVRGVVDGRFFYLRERHGIWRVEIAPDEDPLLDIWENSLPPEVNRVVVAEGSASNLYRDDNETHPVRVAVKAVRSFLLRRSCAHENISSFCPHCGIAADEMEQWRNFQ